MSGPAASPSPDRPPLPALPPLPAPPLPARPLPALHLPSTGPDPIPLDTALDAVLGYARARRPWRFRSPGLPQGRWVALPAYGWARFDAVAPAGDADGGILLAEALHGRLPRERWDVVHDALEQARPRADAAADRAAGRPFWELPDEELSVLGEPGTVGAALRGVGQAAGEHLGHVTAALHHRYPRLVPHLTATTRRPLFPHVEEGDSGVEAVVHRELRANAAAFGRLETAVATLLADAQPSRLRLHDLLLWLTTTLRMAHATEAGRATEEARRPRPWS